MQFQVSAVGDVLPANTRKVNAFAADVTQYTGTLSSASAGVSVNFTMTAVNGATTVTFLNLPPANDYKMVANAFNLSNTQVNLSAPNPDTLFTGQSVVAYVMSRITATPCPLVANYVAKPDGGLSAKLTASDGSLIQFARTPEQAPNSKGP